LSLTIFTQRKFVATSDDHLRLIGKRVVRFLKVLIELFLLGVTAEALRANISSKSAISLQQWPVDPNLFSWKSDVLSSSERILKIG